MSMSDIFNLLFSFLALTILEIVLGIDNLIFLAIISQRLPKSLQKRARRIGLSLAWMMRLLLLASAIWLTKLTSPLFSILGIGFSGRDIFLIAGGAFLIAKSTQEIHGEFELVAQEGGPRAKYTSFVSVVSQIVLLDIIFSLDSVLTAIGLTQQFWLMALSITIAIIIMLFASEALSRFVERHPTIKMLALSFLMLIGTVLVADGFQFHVPRGYIYFAMSFSLFVETLNLLRSKKKTKKRGSH